MTKTTWGGRRAGAGSGGPRPGAGRPRARFTARRGQTYIMERVGASDPFHEPEWWTLLSVQTGMFEFQHGDDIIVIRLPDDDESYDR